MRLLLDSFSRALAYCLYPRVIVLSLLPLALMAALATALGYFYWTPAVDWMRSTLDAWPLLSTIWGWMHIPGTGTVNDALARALVLLASMPLIVLLCLMLVSGFMAPALTTLVAERRFPALQKKGGSFWRSIAHALGVTVLAGLALVLSMPLWLVPPLVLVLPPLIWGWLTYRVMSFDALGDHATQEERQAILRAHRWPLLGIGIVCGYLGAAPSIVWASGLLFVAAFFVLVPIAIWIYMLVFAFSALWFAHYCLDALTRLRAQRALEQAPAPQLADATDNPQAATATQWGAP